MKNCLKSHLGIQLQNMLPVSTFFWIAAAAYLFRLYFTSSTRTFTTKNLLQGGDSLPRWDHYGGPMGTPDKGVQGETVLKDVKI